MKKNLTMAIDAHLLKRARKAAIDKNTSLNELIRKYLRQLAENEEGEKTKTIEALKAMFNQSNAVVGQKNWSRDDLHER